MRFSSTTPSASPGKPPPPTSRSPSTSPPGCRTSSKPSIRSSTQRPRRWTEPDSSCRRISPAQNASPHSERQIARDGGLKNESRPAPRIRRSRPSNKPIAPDRRPLGQTLIRRTLANRELTWHSQSLHQVPGICRCHMPRKTAGRRWLVLLVVAVAQLMVVLDATVVNIALPSAQHALGFSNNDRQWVVTCYALAFGSLLLVGGRIGDMFSRKWVFITGLAGFAVSSAIGGAAVSFAMLVTARTLQGAFGALLAPAALGTLTSTFTDQRERGRAFAVYGAVSSGGAGGGLILGGVLTQYLSWRYTLYVNLVFAAF